MSQETGPLGVEPLPEYLIQYFQFGEDYLATLLKEGVDRLSSTYESRVSFNTFDNKDATDISFTLVSKHKDYAYTRGSRVFLCGTDRK